MIFPMLLGMFIHNPTQRTTASQALALFQDAAVAHPSRPLQDDVVIVKAPEPGSTILWKDEFGRVVHNGERGSFAYVYGRLPAEHTDFLQKDSWLDTPLELLEVE